MNDYDKLKKCFDEIGLRAYEEPKDPSGSEMYIKIFSQDGSRDTIFLIFTSEGMFAQTH